MVLKSIVDITYMHKANGVGKEKKKKKINEVNTMTTIETISWSKNKIDLIWNIYGMTW